MQVWWTTLSIQRLKDTGCPFYNCSAKISVLKRKRCSTNEDLFYIVNFMEQNLWLAAHRFSFWYWKLGGTVKKTLCIWQLNIFWLKWQFYKHTTSLWLCVLHSKDPKRPDRPYYYVSYKLDLLTLVTLQIGFLWPSHILMSWRVHYLRENLWFVQSGNPTLFKRKQSAKWQS